MTCRQRSLGSRFDAGHGRCFSVEGRAFRRCCRAGSGASSACTAGMRCRTRSGRGSMSRRRRGPSCGMAPFVHSTYTSPEKQLPMTLVTGVESVSVKRLAEKVGLPKSPHAHPSRPLRYTAMTCAFATARRENGPGAPSMGGAAPCPPQRYSCPAVVMAAAKCSVENPMSTTGGRGTRLGTLPPSRPSCAEPLSSPHV